MKRRIISIITALALCLSLCPTWAFAVEDEPDTGLCDHHREHIGCGYVAPTEGHDCGHAHGDECYSEETRCAHVHDGSCYSDGLLPAEGEDRAADACAHVCSAESGCVTRTLDCRHSHNSECGYVQADPGAPCGYVCRICPIEDLIAALPEQVTEDNADDVRAQLDEILALYRELDEGEQGQLDLSRCYELQEALDNANAPVQAAEEITINNATVKTLTAEDGDCPGHTFTGTARRTMIYVASGVHNVTFSNLSITGTANVGIAPGATMNLTIEGTNTIQADYNLAGIYVPVGATLAIQGAGSLDVSGDNSAGIGGAAYAPDESGSDGDPNCGTVEINGGTITATGGSRCAGIGGGTTDYVPGNGGTVTINDGTVTAKGGSDNYYGGAGIGGAGGVSNEWNKLVSGNGGTLTINGGTVNLTAGTHNPQYPAYGFGQGSGSASGGTCELTLTDASYLDSSTTLDPNGKYTINGDPTADMIVVPEGLVYTGQALDVSGIKIDDTKTGTGTYFGQTFTVNASADGWVLQDLGEVVEAGEYTAVFKKGDKEISKTFTVAQSGTQFVGDGEVKTYNGDTLTTSFSAGDTIKVVATPTPTGAAPTNSAMFAASFTAPGAGQMAVFVNDIQVSEPVNAVDGSYTMTVSAADVLLAAGGPGTEIPLTARFTANDNMADGAGTVTVNITAVAKAERDGNVIGYFGISNFEGTNNLFCQGAYANATITLLGDVQPGTNSDAGTTCSTMVNITCTLDLAGHNFTSTDTAIYVLPMGNLTIQDSSTGKTGNVSFIKSDGTLKLYGGTFGKIETAYTLASLLAENCAYYSGSTPILLSELEGQKTLDGTVTVQECQHTGVEVKDLGSGKHGLDCPYCGYHSEHTTTLTATVSGNTVTFRGGCESCDYRAETLATAAFTIPKLTYGQTDQTVSCTWEHPDGYALMVQIDSGEELQLESSDTQVSLPLKQLFGSQEINAGNYQLHVYCRSYADVTSNVCSLPVTVDPAPLPEVTLSAESATYSGTEQKPALSVQQGETALTEGTDYEVSYTRDGVVTTDFTNAGTVNITVTGKGNYTGSVEKTYTIGKATPTIAWNPTDVETIYTGQPADIKPVVTLVNGETFSGTITYHHTNTDSSESGESKAGLPTNAGIYVVGARIPEQDNYTAAATAAYLILIINKADQATPAVPSAAEVTDNSITLDAIENAEYKRDDGEWQDSPVFTDLSPNTPYTFYARLKEDANHNASPDSAAASITTKKTMLNTATVTVSGSYTYTGAAIVPEAGNVTVELNGTTINSNQYTISATNNTNAGTATVTITATETGDYSSSVSSTFTISPATPALAWSSATQELPYTGNPADITPPAVTLMGSDTFSGTITYSHAAQGGTEYKDGLPTNAGTYTVKASIAAQGNYTAAESTNTLTLTIKQAQVTITWGNTAQTVTYNGTQATITPPTVSAESGVTVNAAPKYSYAGQGSTEFTSGLPTNAGTYTVRASIAESDNLTAAQANMTLTINKAPLTITGATVASKTYDTTKTATVSGVTFDGLKNGEALTIGADYTATGEFDSASAGTGKSVTVTVTLTSDKAKNYSLAQNTTTVTSDITKASSSITKAPTAAGITYGQALSDSALTGGEGSVEGAFSWTAPDTKPSAGTTQFSVTFTPTDTNYDTSTVNVSVTVAKATPTVTWASATQTVDYTGSEAAITPPTVSLVNGESFSDTISYSYAPSGSTGYTSGLPVNAGTYTVKASIGEQNNYIAAESGEMTLTISKINYTGTIAASTSGKYGREKTYDLSDLLPEGYKLGTPTKTDTNSIFEGTPTVSDTVLTYKLADNAGVGKTGTITIPVTESTNYNPFDLTITVTVTDKIVPTLTITPISVSYTGSAVSAGAIQGTATADGKNIPGSWSFADGQALTNVADSGTKTVNFTPADEVKADYAPATGTVRVTITKATPSLTLTPSPATLPNGGTVTLTLSGLPSGGSATVTCSEASITVTKESGNTWTAELPAGGASYTFTASYSGDGNHNGASANCTVSVEKITPTLSLTAAPTSPLTGGGTVTLTLTGLPAGGTATMTCSGGITVTAGAGSTWTATLPNSTATYTFTASYAGSTTHHSASATCTVETKEVVILPDRPTGDNGEQLRLVMETGISEVPAGLKNIEALNTPEKLETAMRTEITKATPGIPEANTAVYDVALMVSTDGGATWTQATKDNFPSGGLTITLPYPEGTNSNYRFTVVHIFTTSDFGKQPGDKEIFTPDKVKNTAQGLQVVVTGLSPISVGWEQPSTPSTPSSPSGSGGGGGGWTTSTYAVTVEKSEHGKVTSNRTNASSGSTVTLTVTLDSGYVLDTLAVTDSRGNEIKLTAQGNGKYTFTMPGRAVTVKATFAPLPDDTVKPCDGGAGCPSRGFTDLGTVGTWYHEAVDYVLRTGLMGGYGNGLFGPNDTLTRAQFAQILFNKEGKPVVNYLLQYDDVATGAWYTEAIRWATSQGIVGGYGNGLFGPNNNITREQLAVMLWRYAGSPAATHKELHFNDTDEISGFAREALRWAVENGVINGKGNGILDPKGLATRAQVAQMLKNYIETR